VKMFSGNDLPHTIELLSDPFFAAWDRRDARIDVFGRTTRLGGPIAFCYIDGDHAYAQSRRDFENVDRHLVPGGFILFDDSAGNTTVAINGGNVSPTSVQLNNSVTYTLNGPNGIAGTAPLVKNNSGTVSINTANTANPPLL